MHTVLWRLMPLDLNHPWWFYIRFVDLPVCVHPGWEKRQHWRSSHSSGEALQALSRASICHLTKWDWTGQNHKGQSIESLFGLRRLKMSPSFFNRRFSVVADECPTCFKYVHTCLFMKRLDKRGTGRTFLEQRQTDGAGRRFFFFSARVCDCANRGTDSLNHDRPWFETLD